MKFGVSDCGQRILLIVHEVVRETNAAPHDIMAPPGRHYFVRGNKTEEDRCPQAGIGRDVGVREHEFITTRKGEWDSAYRGNLFAKSVLEKETPTTSGSHSQCPP